MTQEFMQDMFQQEEQRLMKMRETNLLDAGEEPLYTFPKTPKQPPGNMFTALSNMLTKMTKKQQPNKEKMVPHKAGEESDERKVVKMSKDGTHKQQTDFKFNPDWPEFETIVIRKQPSNKQRPDNSSWVGKKEQVDHQAVEDLLRKTNWRDLRHSIADCEFQCSRLVSNFANRSMFNPVSPLETDTKEVADRNTTSP